MGCLRRLGCLAVLVVIAIVAYVFRASWIRFIPGREHADSTQLRAGGQWQPLTPEGATRAKQALGRLQSPRGPAYTNVAPGDLAAYIVQELSRTLPASADSIEAAAIGDRLCVRTVMRISELDKGALGPVAMLLGERERLQLCGTLRIIRPGFAELQVKEFRIRDFNVPQALIPRLVRQMSRGTRPPELSEDGLPLRTPEYIGDVRVQNGQITLYRAAAR
jgi:hypothetical protein